MTVETWHIQLAAGEVVRCVLADGRNLNQVLDESMQGKSAWLPAQRAALQELSYGTVRFFGQLQAILGALVHKPIMDERVRYLLLVAIYQLQYGKSAQYAVVDHAVRAARALSARVGGLTNAILRNFLRNRPALLEQAGRSIEGQYNYPEWWVEALREQYGERSTAILEAGNQRPPMTLRVNKRKLATSAYLALLEQQGIPARQCGPDGLQLDDPVAVDKLPGFFEGMASVQDAGAQYAAMLLDVRDGMRVLDACAAPGGKTAHILEHAMAEMVAVDKDAKRLERVATNLDRLGLKAQLLCGDAAAPDAWWDGKPFQRILADVPCSASGVVRRHPDIKWLRRRGDVSGFAAQQQNILRALWRLLAHDGKLLYVTCSVFHEENEQVIVAFLSQQGGARRLPISIPGGIDGQLLPNDQHDGFYYALLQKVA